MARVGDKWCKNIRLFYWQKIYHDNKEKKNNKKQQRQQQQQN